MCRYLKAKRGSQANSVQTAREKTGVPPSPERAMLNHNRFKDIDELFSAGRISEARHLLMEMQARYIAVCDEKRAAENAGA